MANTFFWRCESATLDATDDHSIGDAVGTVVTAASISATAALVGANGVLITAPGAISNYRFDSDIVTGAGTPSTMIGSAGYLVNFRTALPAGGDRAGLAIRGATATDAIMTKIVATDEVQIYIGNNTVNSTLATSGANIVAGTTYGIIIRWNIAANDRAVEVYNSSGTLITSAEDLTTSLASSIPASIDRVSCGDASISANNSWFDNFIIDDTYAGVTAAQLAYTSYTQFSAGSAPAGRMMLTGIG